MGEKCDSQAEIKWLTRNTTPNTSGRSNGSEKEIANMRESDFRSLLLEMEHR